MLLDTKIFEWKFSFVSCRCVYITELEIVFGGIVTIVANA